MNGNPALYIDKIITGFQLRLARTCMISNNITNSAKTGPNKNSVRALVQKHSVRVSPTCVATAAREFGNSPATEGNVGTDKTTTYWWYIIYTQLLLYYYSYTIIILLFLYYYYTIILLLLLLTMIIIGHTTVFTILILIRLYYQSQLSNIM